MASPSFNNKGKIFIYNLNFFLINFLKINKINLLAFWGIFRIWFYNLHFLIYKSLFALLNIIFIVRDYHYLHSLTKFPTTVYFFNLPFNRLNFKFPLTTYQHLHYEFTINLRFHHSSKKFHHSFIIFVNFIFQLFLFIFPLFLIIFLFPMAKLYCYYLLFMLLQFLNFILF